MISSMAIGRRDYHGIFHKYHLFKSCVYALLNKINYMDNHYVAIYFFFLIKNYYFPLSDHNLFSNRQLFYL